MIEQASLAAYRGFTPFIIEEILKKPSRPEPLRHKSHQVTAVQPPAVDLTWNKNFRSTTIPTLPDVSKPNACKDKMQLPAWVYCTRYSDRPSAGPRCRKRSVSKRECASSGSDVTGAGHQGQQKRLRTAFSSEQLQRLQTAFQGSHYLTDAERSALADSLKLNEAQIKIWFQNKRAKLKKNSGVRNELAIQLMAEGLYNHTSVNDM